MALARYASFFAESLRREGKNSIAPENIKSLAGHHS